MPRVSHVLDHSPTSPSDRCSPLPAIYTDTTNHLHTADRHNSNFMSPVCATVGSHHASPYDYNSTTVGRHSDGAAMVFLPRRLYPSPSRSNITNNQGAAEVMYGEGEDQELIAAAYLHDPNALDALFVSDSNNMHLAPHKPTTTQVCCPEKPSPELSTTTSQQEAQCTPLPVHHYHNQQQQEGEEESAVLPLLCQQQQQKQLFGASDVALPYGSGATAEEWSDFLYAQRKEKKIQESMLRYQSVTAPPIFSFDDEEE